MSTTPIADADRARMKETLKEMTRLRDLLDTSIDNVQRDLDSGITWAYEPKAFHIMCDAVMEDVQQRKEEREKKEREEKERENDAN